MNVAVFVEYFPPKLGSDRRIYELMRRLPHKHRIHFIVFPPIRMLLEAEPERNVSNPHFQKNAAATKNAGIVGHFISVPIKIARMWRRSFLIAYSVTSIHVIVETFKVLRKVKPNVVVLNYPSPYTGLLGFALARLLRKPVVLDFNDLIAQYTIRLLNIKESSLKAKLLLLIQQQIARYSDKIVVPTRFIRNRTVSLGTSESKVTIVPNGVDTKKFSPRRCDPSKIDRPNMNEEKNCLYFGRLDAWAGMNLLSKLCERALKKKLNVKFMLAGSGAIKAFHKENAVLLGEAPYDKIPSLLMTANVVLVPFPNNEVSHAASPLKLFEGMSMQKPVIASRISGIEEVISDGRNGFLADPDNIGEWVEKLEIILKSEALAEKVGQEARRTVEQSYDWAYLANRFDEVLNLANSRH